MQLLSCSLKNNCLLFFTLAQLFVSAQITVDPQKINFGDVTLDTDRMVDILIGNPTSNKDYLLRATFSHEFEVRYSSKTLEANSVIVIRIKFNPREKGAFEERVELHFASLPKPIILPITANVLYVNVNENNPCPDFSDQAADCCSQNMFLVEVVDKATHKPIEKSIVKIEEDGFIHLRLTTNAEGKVSQEARIGFYEIIAEKQGYLKGSIHSYINKRNNHFRIELERDPNFKAEEVLYIPPKDSLPKINNTLLPEDKYKPNNIVFLLDVSSSMAVGDKLELLKQSLSSLTGILRPIDQVTLISYAGQAKLLLATTSGDNKEEILSIVTTLRANGITSGAKGFKRSYDTLMKHYIEGGNNQLIVITDGAFKPEDQDAIEKLATRANKKNIHTSVVAIKSNAFAKEKLSLVSMTGNGSFLLIESEEDANQTLIEELKKQSEK